MKENPAVLPLTGRRRTDESREKGNKVYTITEEEEKRYQNDGFDIFSDDGEIIVYGIGKNIPYEEYAALKKENEAF